MIQTPPLIIPPFLPGVPGAISTSGLYSTGVFRAPDCYVGLEGSEFNNRDALLVVKPCSDEINECCFRHFLGHGEEVDRRDDVSLTYQKAG